MDEEKVRLMITKMNKMLGLHEDKDATYIRLLGLCLKHLENKPTQFPNDMELERKALINVLNTLTGVNK